MICEGHCSFFSLVQPIDSWTKDDVHKWFQYCIEEYSLGDINLNGFQMNGRHLSHRLTLIDMISSR